MRPGEVPPFHVDLSSPLVKWKLSWDISRGSSAWAVISDGSLLHRVLSPETFGGDREPLT